MRFTPAQCVAVGALLGLLALGVWVLIYTDRPSLRISPRSECCPAQTSPQPPPPIHAVNTRGER